MSAADRREELEALVRSKTTYLDRLTGRYTAAVSETDMSVILAAADRFATTLAAEELERYDGRARLSCAAAMVAGGQCEHCARTAHMCAECGGRIEPGQRYTCTVITAGARGGTTRLPLHVDGECGAAS